MFLEKKFRGKIPARPRSNREAAAGPNAEPAGSTLLSEFKIRAYWN